MRNELDDALFYLREYRTLLSARYDNAVYSDVRAATMTSLRGVNRAIESAEKALGYDQAGPRGKLD